MNCLIGHFGLKGTWKIGGLDRELDDQISAARWAEQPMMSMPDYLLFEGVSLQASTQSISSTGTGPLQHLFKRLEQMD